MPVHLAILRAIRKEEPGATVSSSGQSSVESSSGRNYFTKVGSPSDTEQYFGEAESLKAMHIAAPGLAPRVLACATIDEDTQESPNDVGRPYFVSEYKNMGSLTDASAKVLARRLASEMHEYKSTQGFGFGVPTYCGATRLENGWSDTWEECFDKLILGLLTTLERRGRYTTLCRKGQEVRERYAVGCLGVTLLTNTHRVIPALLGPLVVEPVLLHGDLWVLKMLRFMMICSNQAPHYVERKHGDRQEDGRTCHLRPFLLFWAQ